MVQKFSEKSFQNIINEIVDGGANGQEIFRNFKLGLPREVVLKFLKNTCKDCSTFVTWNTRNFSPDFLVKWKAPFNSQ